MILPSSRLFSWLKLLIPVFAIFWFASYFTGSSSAYTEVLRKFRDEKKLFISDFLDHEIDGEFDGSSIAELCNNKTWTKGLILSCDSPAGGVGNVKNSHLNCIRFAIEMGAELILPGIIQRNEHDISTVIPNAKAPQRGVSLDYFFDYEHLNRSLTTHCPQLKLHRSLNDLWEVASVLTAHKISINETRIQRNDIGVIATPEHVSTQLSDYVNSLSPPDKRVHPVRFNLETTYFAWPTASDGEPFARHFGRILRTRRDARRLAAAAIFAMQKRFDLSMDPRSGIPRAEHGFVGVHLRTEKDAIERKFPSYEEQAAYYLEYASQSASSVAFLATGASPENVTAFVQRSRDFNVSAVLKRDLLLDPEEGAALAELTYDQRALVDYEVMLRAGLMTGTAQSPFAWNLAMRRRNAYGLTTEPEPTNPNLSIQWKDKYSTIFGQSRAGSAMQLTIWP